MENEGYETIDLLEVLNAVRQHLLAVILTTVILAGVGFGVSKFLITPQYEASALMIVNTRQDTTSNVTSDQINSATKLVSTYSIIIKSDTVLQQVIDNLGLSLTYEKLAERVTVSAVDDTQVMKVTVKSDNPEWARQVCEQITVVSPDVILESVEAGSVKVISSAAVNPTPVSPNVGRNTMLGGVLGLVISVGIILLAVLLDNKIHTEDDIAKYLDLAVVGVIPEYQGGKRNEQGKQKHQPSQAVYRRQRRPVPVCGSLQISAYQPGISFLCRQLQDHPDHLLRSRRRQDQRGRQPGHDDCGLRQARCPCGL